MDATTALLPSRGWSVCPGISWSVCPESGGQFQAESPIRHSHIDLVMFSGISRLSLFLPDVLLLDILMPGQSGKVLAPVIKELYPSVKIVVLTSLDAPAMVSSMMRRGCSGYLLKDTDRENLIAAIETVHSGKEFIDPSLKEKILTKVIHPGQEKDTVVQEITKRELQILKLLAEEHTTREISEQLFISFRTVENHRYSLLQKLDVKNTVGLVKVALQLGLIK